MIGNDAFKGFSQETLSFLEGLTAHNDRDWFTSHKSDYEMHLLTPTRQLVTALVPTISAIDPEIHTDLRSGVLSRIYRDTRFSKDKSPYRINQWLTFKYRTKDWATRPAFFMEFGINHYRYGMGFYSATASTMAAIRAHIQEQPRLFLAAMEKSHSVGYALEGDIYKKPHIPQNQPADIQNWYMRKNVYLVRTKSMDEVFFSPSLVEELKIGFEAAMPLYHFLLEALPSSSEQ
jgi:uncharacterized protein (TIGR02453 family)